VANGRRMDGEIDRAGGVNEIQRARILAAIAEVCCERGVSDVTVADIVARAGVSRRTFYELFDDREQCFLVALDEAIELAARRVVPAYRAPGRWPEQVRAGVVALLSFLDDEPNLGRLLIVETLAAGRLAMRRRRAALGRVFDEIDRGGRAAAGALDPAPIAAEGAIGGGLSVLHARIDHGDSALLELAGQLTSMIVLPYLGASAARRELLRAPPGRILKLEPTSFDPLREVGMRLTYRTMRMLKAVGEHPGACNRELGLAADISDQGQISKLLMRLQGLGLIQNTGAGHARGQPNAWMLTATGGRVERSFAQLRTSPPPAAARSARRP
jgi:AcrR family transcriptional regulator